MRRLVFLWIGLLIAGGIGPECFAGETPGARGEFHALLVGCTRYPKLPKFFWLKGPANDLALIRHLLLGKFEFPEPNVRTLSEESGADEDRPVRANIEREFRRLATVAHRGDYVVIFLAGHGSSQPDNDPDNPDDVEPDGCDEVFCAADVESLTAEDGGQIPNAIVDDEIRAWLDAIRAKGASVWVIVDACHSGTVTRGNGEEVDRQIPSEVLVPEEALDRSLRRGAERSEVSRGAAGDDVAFELTDESGGLVATYAAQPYETTPEKRLPADRADAKRHGLVTYTLAKVLSESRSPLTYGELVGRIHRQYVKWGRTGPTPLVEGSDRDRQVLGRDKWPARSRTLLQRNQEDGFQVTAGSLEGLMAGCVLAVYPPPGQEDADRVLGHVRVSEVRPLEADVEPCAYGEQPSRDDLPDGARCRVVKADYGDLRLKVAMDAVSPEGAPPSQAIESFHDQLKTCFAEEASVIQLCEEPARADWLVRVARNEVLLVPGEGWARSSGGADTKLFGPVPLDDRASAWAEDRLVRIARARNLLRIAAEAEDEQVRGWSSGEVDVRVEMLRLEDKQDRRGTPVRWQRGGIQLQEGDLVRFRVENGSRFPVDVSLLFVDSGYGIHPIFPRSTRRDYNRLASGETLQTRPFRVTGTTLGLEHLVVIAVMGEGETVDFCWLGQPTIESARGDVATRGGGTRGFDSPLGSLLQQGMYAEGGQRGLAAEEADDVALRVFSWQTSAVEPPP